MEDRPDSHPIVLNWSAAAAEVPPTALLLLGDDEVGAAMGTALRRAGLQAMVARDLEHARRIVEQVVPDVLVGDADAPGVDAWVQQHLRDVPVTPETGAAGGVRLGVLLVASGRDEPALTVAPLRWITKPVTPAALVTHVTDALVVRHQVTGADGPLPVLESSVMLDPMALPDLLRLAPTERKLFIALAQVAPRLLRREQIRERVWAGEAVSPRVVDQYVKRLRERLRVLRSPLTVATVRGHGYRLDAPAGLVIKPSSSVPTVDASTT
jgi:DNA-binding response OmpR family regulator